MKHPRCLAAILAVLLTFSSADAQTRRGGIAEINPTSLRQLLTQIASDDFEGRDTFSEGLGLAAAFIAGELKAAGVKPGGDRGTYFQRVEVLGVRSTNRSTVTVEVNGITRTFRDGEGISFPKNVGGKQTVTLNEVVFVGYGLNLGSAHNDYRSLDVKGKAVIWMGARAPRSVDQRLAASFLRSRPSIAIDENGAGASIAPSAFFSRGGGNQQQSGRGGPTPDFTTTEQLDRIEAPDVTAADELMEFLFSASDIKYPELKMKGEQQEDLPTFALTGVKLTFNLDADYQVVDTQYTRNVVGIVEGADPRLKDTYVALGCHYDHVGYERGVLTGTTDRIYNGADDDGSGITALISLARAFALGPKPKRSLLFVFHAGEEMGLYGSRYFVDHPIVPLENIVTQLNVDMIGRNYNNLQSEANMVFTVGSDRISTDLHNVMIDANNSLSTPLALNYEWNEPWHPERIYYRSDHFSYAAKGIPVVFFFTGLHPDYHQVTDSVEKINFEKMTRIAQLVYETGRRVANSDAPPARDFKGPRMGKGGTGKLVSTK